MTLSVPNSFYDGDDNFEKIMMIMAMMMMMVIALGKPSRGKSEVFLNIVQKAFGPPPLLFEHLSYFAGGVFSCGEFFK